MLLQIDLHQVDIKFFYNIIFTKKSFVSSVYMMHISPWDLMTSYNDGKKRENSKGPRTAR